MRFFSGFLGRGETGAKQANGWGFVKKRYGERHTSRFWLATLSSALLSPSGDSGHSAIPAHASKRHFRKETW
jgi:hypothetical protein